MSKNGSVCTAAVALSAVLVLAGAAAMAGSLVALAAGLSASAAKAWTATGSCLVLDGALLVLVAGAVYAVYWEGADLPGAVLLCLLGLLAGAFLYAQWAGLSGLEVAGTACARAALAGAAAGLLVTAAIWLSHRTVWHR